MKILFVCLGNICRSPLAEAIFKERLRQQELDHLFEADSCGTSNYNIGDDPDPRTVRSARQYHIPIVHKARQFTPADGHNFDLILAMDNANYQHIINITHAANHDKVRLMRSYDPLENGNVPDPYYGNEKDFDEVFKILERAIDALIRELHK
jgi:protein-tyrosine phosphatase